LITSTSLRRWGDLARIDLAMFYAYRIARLLLAEGLGSDFHMAVAEHLLQPDERVHAQLSPAEAARMRFAEPNVVLLWRTRPRPQPVRSAWPIAPSSSASPRRA